MIIREVAHGGVPDRESVRVVLLDRDPLSRQFLLGAFAEAAGVEVHPVGSAQEVLAGPGGFVVLMAGTPDQPAQLLQLRALTAAGHRVLLLGIEWTQRGIRDALEAGASGCVVKSLDVPGLVAALRAVASGHIVISPELLSVYLGSGAAVPVAPREADVMPDPAPDREALRLLELLTARELEVLGLLGEGLSTRDVARRLGVSMATVKSHVSHVLSKLGVQSRVQAVLIARDRGLVTIAARRRDRGVRDAGPDL